MITNKLNLSSFLDSDVVFAMHTCIFGEVCLNLISLLMEQMEELLTLLDHVLFIFVNEDWSHNELIKSVEILLASFIHPLFSLVVMINEVGM